MSVYNFLSAPVPTIAYCAMHQSLPQVPRDEYMKTMRELHARISEESRTINAGYASFLREALGRESESLHGSLSQFLQTPISSDDSHVRQTLRETLERLKDELVGRDGLGLQHSVEGRVIFPPSKTRLEKKVVAKWEVIIERFWLHPWKGKGRCVRVNVRCAWWSKPRYP
jgi:hypothetical protein